MPSAFFTQADIHPEGTAAVFWGVFDSRPRVWLYDFTTKSARPLTADNVGSLEPSFDWQGRRIVFAADVSTASPAEISAGPGSWRRSNMNLFVMDANGSNLRRVTEGAFQDSRPAFSPDGTKIVFLSNRDGSNRQLYVVPVDRSTPPRRLLPETVIIRPWYSLDGKFIYFTFANLQFNSDQIRIWRIPADGGAMEPITPEGLPNSQGLFVDPDGLHLWFHSSGAPYRFRLETRTLVRVMPPGFTEAAHVTRSRNGVITFDSTQSDPTASR
jgi:Tol biopolymer transport system component